MPEAVIVSAVRTPVGRYGGGLAGVRPDDLAALAVSAAVERAGVPPGEIEDVWLGCANQAGEDNRNVARFAALLAGLPETVAGVTVNRLCASGLSAIAGACHAVIAGDVAMRADEVTPVLKALRSNGIDIVAIHHHMTGTEPTVFFLHYWGRGPADKLATAFRAAVDRIGRKSSSRQ